MSMYLQEMLDAFPEELENDIKSIFNIITFSSNRPCIAPFDIVVNGEVIHIPDRIYCEEPDATLESKLSKAQKQILDCYFTRHYNGYVRQSRLNRIFARGVVEGWVIPYIIKLVGEYIVEIIEDIYVNLDLMDQDELIKFINENQRFITTTEGRVASYWGEYYRRYPKNDYVGFKMKKYLQSLRKLHSNL